MKTYNYNYYGTPTGNAFINQDSVTIGDLVPLNIWGYYYDGNPDNADHIGKPMDDSVYLWRVAPTASYGTNAAYNIATGNTLNIDLSYNQQNTPVSLAMAASDVSGIDADNGKGFTPNPAYRLAYDTSNSYRGYQHTGLFYDIVYSSFCAVPVISVYDKDNDSIDDRSLTTLKLWIDNDSTNRFVSFFRFDLYSGTKTERVLSEYANEGIYRTVCVPDILSDRPIPDSCSIVKDAVGDVDADPPHSPAWINDKVYSPFAAAICREFSADYTEVTNNQYRVGFNTVYTPAELRTGKGAYSDGVVTGQFMRYNPTEQHFDDVAYKWDVVIYDATDDIYLQPGYDISSLSHDLRFMTKLTIIDYKDATTEGEAVLRAIKHEMAFTGFYFADNSTLGQTGVLGSAGNGVGIYLPEKVNRTTTGNYFTGADIKKVPYADAETVDDFPYDESESDSGDLTTHTHSGVVMSSARILALDAVDMTLLSKWLNLTYKPDDADLTADFKGVNPADYIVSIRYYPFEVPASASSVDFSVGGIRVEYNNTGSSVNIMPYEYGKGSSGYFDLGSFVMQPPYCFGDFRDNYIKLQLYIPWCGYVDLDPAVYCISPDNTYHTINAAIQIDFCTGAAMGLVYRDGLLMETINGTVGVDIPLSAIAQGSYQTAIKQAEIALKQSKLSQVGAAASGIGAIVGTAAAIATGGAAGVAIGALGMANSIKQMYSADVSREAAEYNIDHVAPTINNVSAASPFNGALSEQAARIFIYKPATLAGADITTYGNTVGFACCKSGKLSDFHGLTVCSNVKLDAIDAPAHHKAAIQQALIKGVYLP